MSTLDTEQALTPAGKRILDVASRLFYEHGIRAVGVDMIAREADVTKKTIYDRFGSKDQLITRYLEARDRMWREVILSRIDQANLKPSEKILAVFESLDDWFQREMQPRGCSFINAYAELAESDHPARPVIQGEKRWLRSLFRDLAAQAGYSDPDSLATQLHLLHEGAYIAYSITGIQDAAWQARAAAEVLLSAQLQPGDRKSGV